MMDLMKVYNPIFAEQVQVENDIRMSLGKLGFNIDGQSIKEFSEYQINHIGSALLLLSAKSVNPQISEEINNQIVRMGAIMEFVYNAVIVHNNLKEKHETECAGPFKAKSDNRISILGGDILYTLAFLMTSEQFPNGFMQKIAKLTEKMCLAEIEQRRNNIYSLLQDRYYEVIEDKTASFMAACCRFGALLVGADEITVNAMESFGLNFGMAYQMTQDCSEDIKAIDKDSKTIHLLIKEAEKYSCKAIDAVVDIPDSPYKDGLLKLLKHTVN